MTGPAWKACLDCGEPSPYPRCPNCQAEADRRTSARRGSAHARGYTAAWRTLCNRVRREEPACAVCGTTVDLTTDHVIPKVAGGTDDRDNLTTLCRRHNGAKAGR